MKLITPLIPLKRHRLSALNTTEKIMGIFTRFRKSFFQAAERAGKARAHQQLLRMSDWQLEEYGFSKALLLDGVKSWPWRTSTGAGELAEAVASESIDSQSAQSRSSINQAINELSNYSDRELAELGITRHGIEEAVLHGRPASVYESQKRAA